MAAQGPRGATSYTWRGTGRSHKAELGRALAEPVSTAGFLSQVSAICSGILKAGTALHAVSSSALSNVLSLTGRHAETLIW